jgi:hypothetical protein
VGHSTQICRSVSPRRRAIGHYALVGNEPNATRRGSIQASSKFVERDTEPIQDDDGKVAVLIENRGEHVVIAGRSRVIENGRQASGDARVPLRR